MVALKPSTNIDSNKRMQKIIETVGLLGFIVHALLILVFVILSVPHLVILEILSTSVWLCALKFNRNNNMSTAVLLMVGEVLIHSSVVVFTMGLAPGFQHYLWAAVPFILFYRQIPLWGIIGCTLSCMGLYIASFLFAQDVQYSYGFEQFLPYVHATNLIIAFLALGLTCFHFYNATMEAEQEVARIADEKVQLTEQMLSKKNEFFANVSHEFRTPLTLITGPLESVLSKSEQLDRKTIETVFANAKRLQRMVEQILDLTKHEQSNNEVVNRFDLSVMCTKVTGAFKDLAQKHKITIHTKLQPACIVNISIEDAEAIISNLISNAIKYSRSESNITVKCRTENSNVIMCIQDKGIGIAIDDQQRIFERFVRLEHDLTNIVAGTGIGLSLVKDLVTRAQGEVKVESDGLMGSTFIVTLPFSAHEGSIQEDFKVGGRLLLEQENLSHQLAPQKTQSTKEYSQNLPHVLIVEDNIDMQEYIAQCLHGMCNVSFASNGEHGLALAKEWVPDLILTDLMMPKMNGFQLANCLRAEILTCHIPILMLTAKGDESNEASAWKMDIDAFMSKPFSPEMLKTRVENLLNIRLLITKRLSEQPKNKSVSLPNEQAFSGINSKDRAFIVLLEQWVEQNFHDQSVSIKSILPDIAMSERQLQRKMKALLDQTFSEYVRVYRLTKGAEMLHSELGVTQVALECGFSSQSYFSLCFKAHFGVAPSQYISDKSTKHDAHAS